MSVSTKSVSVAIVGAGSAGLRAMRFVRQMRMSSVMIDPGPYGTTCARVGCMPSKLLIAAADAAHEVQKASMFGVDPGNVTVDGVRVMARVRAERDRFVGFVHETLDDAAQQGELIRGKATLRAHGVLHVDEHDGSMSEVCFERLVLAVGSRPVIPKAFRHIPRSIMITNEDVFELKDLPKSMLVVGLGAIGLELGQAMHRLGVRVTFVGRGASIGPLSDAEVLQEAHRIFKQELDLHSSYTLKSMKVHDDGGGGVDVDFIDSDGKSRRERYDKVLMAAGRRSNLDQVGLEHVDVHPDEHGRYNIDKGTLQLGDLPIFVAGDANGFHPLLHEAADDGTLAGENAVRYPEVLAPLRRVPLAVVFSDPQIATIGHDDLASKTQGVASGTLNYANQGRARVMGAHKGLIKVYGDCDSGRLLGGEFLGPRVEHMAHLLAWAIQSQVTVDEALKMPFYHPVLEEGLRSALRALSTANKQCARLKCRVSEPGVGS